jgi:glycerophosphoryl diester phosphodiesterase
LSAWATSPLVVGHRGGRGEGWPPENTIPAFERARAQGAVAIELDVLMCAGGSVVVFHDDTLERMTGGRDLRPVQHVGLDELGSVDLGHGARVPALEDVLSWARRYDIAVNVEMKHGARDRLRLARATVRVVQSSGADVLLSSFDPALLAMTGALAPRICRALLTHARQARWADALQLAVRPPFVQALHLERTQWKGRLHRYMRRGLRLGAWTVNDPVEARELVRLGVASIITDAPGAILEALELTHI